MNGIYILVAALSISGWVKSECEFNAYSTGDAQLYGYMGGSTHVFKQVITRSRMDCDRLCTRRSSCLSYTFDPAKNRCHLFKAKLTNNIGMVPTTGSVYYNQRKIGSFKCPKFTQDYMSVNYINNTCIQIRAVHINRNHYDAAADCEATGGRLMAINTTAKWSFYRNLVYCPGFSNSYIVDGSNVNATDYTAWDAFRTSSGVVIPVVSPLWAGGPPNWMYYSPTTQHCLYMHPTHHHTFSCTSTMYYMCERQSLE